MKKFFLLILSCVSIYWTLGACPVPEINTTMTDTKSIIEITNDKGLYIIKIPKKRNYNVYPYVTNSLVFNSEVYNKTGAELVINAGYFDPNNKATTSYVVIDGKTVLNPKNNPNLMQNNALIPYLDNILNRTEFRVLNCKGDIKYDIAPHLAKAPYKCKIVHSVQAGPLLYPNLELSKEYFVEKDSEGNIIRDSIHALKKCARTAIGIKDDDIYIIIANIYHKITLPELHEICKNLNLDKAMNFDGGGSTSLNFRGTDNPQYKNLEIVSDKNITPRKVKSFLIVQ